MEKREGGPSKWEAYAVRRFLFSFSSPIRHTELTHPSLPLDSPTTTTTSKALTAISRQCKESGREGIEDDVEPGSTTHPQSSTHTSAPPIS